ncbi:MAG TPA: hypothetical protein DCL44_07625 [Elusimicrobia bacterium]|nr:hypothetical protein [Elusimicrobiota bacterium]
MAKRILFSLILFCAASAALAYRPYGQKTVPKVSWMNVSAPKTEKKLYMEISQDGRVMMRTETKTASITRRGVIRAQLAKDFFREIESSEILNFQNGVENKMIFYRGQVLSISAYINGELRRVDAPLNSFGEAFSHAFGEAKKNMEKLPPDKKLYGFLSAEPIEGEELDRFRSHASKEHIIKDIETYDIQKVKPLFDAIKQPYRLIPLQKRDDTKDIQLFISVYQLYGISKLFYLPSTRGVFKCQLKETGR